MSVVYCEIIRTTYAKLNLPLTVRGILRLAKKHNAKLSRGATRPFYEMDGTACALTVLAIENHDELNDYSGYANHLAIRDKVISEDDPNLRIKLCAIEDGFEGWKSDPKNVRYNNPTVYDRYFKVGEGIYKASNGDIY